MGVIVRTLGYSVDEIVQVISIRAQTENLDMEQEAIELLGEIGQNTSLRYVVQLMTPASVLAKTNGRDTVTREDIEEIDQLSMTRNRRRSSSPRTRISTSPKGRGP